MRIIKSQQDLVVLRRVGVLPTALLDIIKIKAANQRLLMLLCSCPPTVVFCEHIIYPTLTLVEDIRRYQK